MEYRRVFSFVGRRSTTAETTAAAAAAHLGVTTYTFLVFVPGTFLRALYNINHHECSFRKRVGRKQKNTEQDQPAVCSAAAAAVAEAAAAEASSTSSSASTSTSSSRSRSNRDAESTSEHLRIQQYAILFRFNFWRRKKRT